MAHRRLLQIFAQLSLWVPSPAAYNLPGGEPSMPVPGAYNGTLRPQVHFSPPQHFMNDPNGLFIDNDGIYHLYYQYNPNGLVAGNQHWGHATSTDLYHWMNQPISLFPPNNFTYVFSGSAVVDVNNTSGFFSSQDNGVVAIYTLAEYPNGEPGPQQQAIAYSYDNGYTFIPYEGNPVIPSTSTQFRDPKVIWHRDRWVMVVAYSQEFAIGFYTSPNLRDWAHASNFSYHGLLGLQYECPNLVEMPIHGTAESMYVLQISVNPGAPLGGSFTEYFPGHFNGTHFEPVDGAARVADFGKDYYAGQFFHGTPPGSGPISIAWASNWEYTQLVPTGPREGWRGAMSLPRQHFLKNVTRAGWDMISMPYDMSPVLGKTMVSKTMASNEQLVVDYSSQPSNALHLEVSVRNIEPAALGSDATLNFTFRSPLTGERIEGGFFFAGDNGFFVDRGGVRGFENPFFTDKFSTATPIQADKTWSMTVVIDRSIIEIFLEKGARTATATFFPLRPLTELVVRTSGLSEDMIVDVAVRALGRSWAQFEDNMGIAAGNVSMHMRSNMRPNMSGAICWGSQFSSFLEKCANPAYHLL